MKIKVTFKISDYATNVGDNLEPAYFTNEAPYFKKNYIKDTFQVDGNADGFLRVSYRCGDEVEVEAESAEEALEIAENNIDEIRENYFDGEGNLFSDFYIDGTFEIVGA